MSKKEELFCLFTSCFRSSQKQEQVIIDSNDQLKLYSAKYESKISLKHTKQSSIHSQIKQKNQISNLRKKSQKVDNCQQKIKENRIITTNRHFNSPCEKKMTKKMPLDGMLMRSAPSQQHINQLNFNYSSKLKINSFDETQLQKTTKITGQRSQQSLLRTSKFMNLQLQQTKVLKKSLVLKSLNSYKESVVSIINQNESINQKLEQSMIMIDYFHPPQEKAMQYQKYLVYRS